MAMRLARLKIIAKRQIKKNPDIYNYLTRIKWNVYRLIPNKPYVKMQYKSRLGKKLILNEPQTFNEKLQWLKLNWKDPILTQCADKYEVRKYVEQKLGEHILNTIYGVYKKVEDIDTSELPKSFVIKVNHGSGQNIFCKDKNNFDFENAFSEINKFLKINHYHHGREWAYKNIKPLIIIEEYLDDNGHPPNDYKFFCFNGEPQFIQMDIDRFGNHTRNIYDLSWNLLEFRIKYNSYLQEVPRPTDLEEMIRYASILSKGFPFVRVDFYNFQKNVYFGEMTFYPGNGGEPFYPNEYDLIVGKKLMLPTIMP